MNWNNLIELEKNEPYFIELNRLLECKDVVECNICPPHKYIFRIFENLALEDVKVVILGQDPYYAKLNEANGYAFAVNENIKTPSSLKNIFKEIASDFDSVLPKDKTLDYLVKQGVFLLNTALTTQQGVAFAHGKQWQPFTDKVVELLGERDKPIIFMLWGLKALAKKSLITNKCHYILEAPHPSGLSAYRGFYGCKHFSKANSILKEIGLEEIDWIGDNNELSF